MKKLLLMLSFFLIASYSWAQDRTVSGTVVDEDGPLPGVNVIVKGTTIGTTTDLDGNYKLSVSSDAEALLFTYIGFEKMEVAIGSKSVIDVTLQPDVQQLGEVVVTALGVSREKRSIGYSTQSVDGEKLAESRETNIVNSLQGAVAGVQIQGSQGAMGGSSRITIRGANSFLGENQPLFVVDGMPINNDNYASAAQQEGFGGGSYDYGNAASDINPNDIESMEVLKGAAATALYGTRGSNGVILITTKSASRKKGLGVSINSSATFENPLALMEHQQRYGGGATTGSASGFVEFTEDGTNYLAPVYSKDGAWGPKYDPSINVRHWDSWDPDAANYGETRPWVAPENQYEEFFETGVTLTNSVAVSGANDEGDFRLSYTNLDQKGMMPNSELGRNTVSFNSSYNLTDKLSVSAAGSLIQQDASGRNATGYANANPMQGFYQWWQTQLDFDRLKDDTFTDGTQQTWNPTGTQVDPNTGELLGFDPNVRFFDNPYWVRNNYLQEDTRDRFFGNFNLNYELTDGLSVNVKAMRDGFTFRSREGVPVGGINQPSYNEVTRTFSETNLEGKILYDTQFNEDITLNAMVGGNLMSQGRTFNRIATVGGLVLPNFYNIANSAGSPQIDTDFENRAINSVFTTASLGLFYTVYVDLALRGDWSSTLPEGDNNYWYPSVSTSFVFSELDALANNSVISFGKLRAGYGQAANDANPYQLRNVYSNVVPNFGSFPRYTVPNSRRNPNLLPEITNEFELGLEMNFLNNRVGFDVSYYDRTTVNQIFNVPSSSSTGFTSRLLNAGSMRNSGFEVMLNATPIQSGDFRWDMNLNFATFNNEVVELNEDAGVESIIAGTTWAADVRVQKGFPYMSLFGQTFQTDDDGNTIVGANGIPLANQDREFLGSTIADFAGGFRNTFTYKNFSVGALIDFQGGGVIHSTSLQWAKYSGMLPETAEGNIREEGVIVDGVTETGETNTTAVPAQTFYQSIWTVAAPNVYDASFVKLREVTVGYNIPNSVFGNLAIKDARISFLGRNLAILFSNLPYLDPQGVNGAGNIQGLENAQVPTSRSLGFDLSFKF
ncbi:SusC/RagA family TonB-linked outer membrane protein [Marivirga harenae]|uniref:SusC/RagA family TonB-linked outer membrane protein n=1 Tax=Marivirga harenae TaxID=2010992 RepID=UPI0026DFBCCE|nr:SusC/RagA family TonB-linked outer membrane protein [Marivirga harenae]WKV11867.1 SusC/RagA family TonB-linked outer membrane protein [Marivirga harenae]